MECVQIEIEGMTCADCARHVAQALREAGASDISVDWRSGQGSVEPAELTDDQLHAALEDTRYRVIGVNRLEHGPEEGGWDFDLIVVGSGGGAFAAAIRARDLGRNVLMVEHAMIGGTCVNVGCIPSKRLLVASERGDVALAAAVAGKTTLVARLRQAKYIDLLDEYGIEFRAARAELIDGHTVSVDGDPISASAIVIATGARPSAPPIDGLEEAGYLTSTSALELQQPPGRIAVIGTGSVGLELGQMLGNFGSKVTFISRRSLAPTTEPEIADVTRQVLNDQGHEVLEHAHTESVRVESGAKVLRGRGAEGNPFERRVDELLVATGRTPNTEGLGLLGVGVHTDAHGAIAVDEQQRTSVPSIFAAGDVTTQPQYVYVAAAGGAAAAMNALTGASERLDFSSLPRIVFTRPQIARAGMTEAEASAAGFEVATRVLLLDAVPRAIVNDDTRGAMKLVAEAGTGRLLGASAIADGAGEVIQAAVLAIDQRLTVGQLASAWAPYLTMAEGLKLAAQTFERDVAKLSCCAA